MNHWKFFARFCRAELRVGGPDAQLGLIARYVGEGCPRRQQVWMSGIYCAHHTGASAFAVFQEFPDPYDVLDDQKKLRSWLRQHWDDLPLRREMRSHRMLEKRVECLRSFAQYAVDGAWRNGDYEDVWDSSIRDVKFFGRYMALKYLELLRMTARPDLVLNDLRAKHAWSPRIALAWLYPKHADRLLDRKDNSPKTIAITERVAAKLFRTMRGPLSIDLNYFQLQVLLCNYKQTTLGRFYPGMGLDEELEYMRQAKRVCSMKPLFALRRAMYDKKNLGEVSGWNGIRPDELAHWKFQGAQVQ